MTDKRNAAPKIYYIFVPQTLEPEKVNKMTVKLYPVIDSTIKLPDHAHTFQVDKTALAAPGIDHCMMLNTLGAQLNLSAIVDGVLGNWNCHFCRNWFNFANDHSIVSTILVRRTTIQPQLPIWLSFCQ